MNSRELKVALFGLIAVLFGLVLVLAGLVVLLLEALPRMLNGASFGLLAGLLCLGGLVFAGIGLSLGWLATASDAQ